MRTLHVDDSTVLKLAIGASLAAVAVTTFHGLYLADFSSASGSPGALFGHPVHLHSAAGSLRREGCTQRVCDPTTQ